jgi:hypothetical protein
LTGRLKFGETGKVCIQSGRTFPQTRVKSAGFAANLCGPSHMCDRLALNSSDRDDGHGALLDADMTADALILLERQLKYGASEAPRTWSTE